MERGKEKADYVSKQANQVREECCLRERISVRFLTKFFFTFLFNIVWNKKCCCNYFHDIFFKLFCDDEEFC